MMMQNLIFVGDKVPSLFAVTGDGGTGHRQFYPELQFDGSVDNCIKSEDLLYTVGVFGVSPHADPGINVVRQLGTSKEEGVRFGVVAQDDFRKDPPFDDQVEVFPLQSFLNAKDLIEDAGILRIGHLKSESQDFHLGPGGFGIFRKAAGGAFHLDAYLSMKCLLVGMVQPIENASSNIFDNADKLDTVAFFLKPGAAFISGTGRKESPVGGDDFIGEKPEAISDLHQNMENLIVEFLPQPFFKIRKSGFAGDVPAVNAGVKTKVFPLIPVSQHCCEGFHVGVFFEVAEEIQQKKADGIIGKPDQAILMGDNGTDKRKVYQ